MVLFISKIEQINIYATPNQYIGMAYMANLLPTKILIKRNKIAGIIEIALLKLKNINNTNLKAQIKQPIHLFSPKTTFEYSLKSSVCNSVIVLKVSGNSKLLVMASF